LKYYLKGMEMANVELPAALVNAAGLNASNLSQETARLLALELFREEKVFLAGRRSYAILAWQFHGF
jgi:hypothetical protein